MRETELKRVAEALREPMKTFIRESRARTAILVSHSGQVLAHHGFARSYDIASVASLAAAAHSSAFALAQLTGAGEWEHLHHAGRRNQLFLAPFRIAAQEFVLVAIFDHNSTLGMVQLFFERLVDAAGRIPELQRSLGQGDAKSFERELEAGLERVLSDPED